MITLISYLPGAIYPPRLQASTMHISVAPLWGLHTYCLRYTTLGSNTTVYFTLISLPSLE